MRRWLSTIVIFALMLGCMAVAVNIQRAKMAKVQYDPPFQDNWLFKSNTAEAMGALALGYDLVVADFLWLRAIQSFGGRGMTNRSWEPVYAQFDAITNLDPSFEQAYTFGSLVIGDEGGQQREGLKLLRKGTENLIYQYRVPYEAMYVAHWTLKDTKLARWYGRIAAKRRDAPDWVPRVAAYLDVQSGEYYIGIDRFIGNLIEGIDGRDETLMRIGTVKLIDSIRQWNRERILAAVDEYTSATGRIPSRLDDLTSMPTFADYETVSFGRLLAKIIVLSERTGNDEFGKIIGEIGPVQRPTPEELAEADRGTSAGQTSRPMREFQNEILKFGLIRESGKIPPDPTGVPYALNMTLLADPTARDEQRVMPFTELVQYRDALIQGFNTVLEQRKAELGRNPADLREAFYTDLQTTEPLGGRWIYDPQTGKVHSSTQTRL